MTSESAEISVPLSTAVNVQANRFNVVGTATQAGDSATVTSDAATYPANAIFNDLDSNTSYSFVIQIVSRAADHKIIGSFNGTLTTHSSLTSSFKGRNKFLPPTPHTQEQYTQLVLCPTAFGQTPLLHSYPLCVRSLHKQ